MATISAPVTRRRSSAETSPLTHVDMVLLALPFAISALGLLMIYDASRAETARAGPLAACITSSARASRSSSGSSRWLFVAMSIDYRRIRDAWPLVYLAVLPLLVGVLVLGRSHGGAQAWFQVGPLQFQPSEIAKVVRGRRDRGLLPSTSR